MMCFPDWVYDVGMVVNTVLFAILVAGAIKDRRRNGRHTEA